MNFPKSPRPASMLAARKIADETPPAPALDVNARHMLALLERPIAFHPVLAHVAGGAAAGLFLSQALYWTKVQEKSNPGAAGWFFKNIAEWTTETCLTEDQQTTVKRTLVKLRFIEIQKRGTPARNFYRLDLNEISAAINRHFDLITEPKKAVTSRPENQSQEPAKSVDSNVRDNTEETTREQSRGKKAKAEKASAWLSKQDPDERARIEDEFFADFTDPFLWGKLPDQSKQSIWESFLISKHDRAKH